MGLGVGAEGGRLGRFEGRRMCSKGCSGWQS